MKIVVVGNGPLPPEEKFLASIESAEFTIAADGGARHFLKFGKLPNLVIGDLDSLSCEEADFLKTECLVYKFPMHKNETDLKLAFLEAERRGARAIEVFSWADERIDYSLGALLDAVNIGAEVELVGERSRICLLNSFRPDLLIDRGREVKASIFPLTPEIELITNGFRWDFSWAGAPVPPFSQSNSCLRGLLKLSRGSAFVLLEDAPSLL